MSRHSRKKFRKRVKSLSRYWKAIIASLVPVALTASEAALIAFGDNKWTGEDTLKVTIAVLGAIGVYSKANVKPEEQPYDPTVSEAEVP